MPDLFLSSIRDKKKIVGEQHVVVLQQQQHICGFCKFKSEAYQSVHSLDQRNSDGSDPVLIPVDPLCRAAVNLQAFIDQQDKTGLLIYLPGVKQTDMNHLMRAFYYSYFYGGEEEQQEAVLFFKELLKLGKPVKKVWGSVDPGDFGQILQDLPEKVYEKRTVVMRNLVLILLPSFIRDGHEGYSIDMVRDWFESYEDFVANWQFPYEFYFGEPEA
jgi:hypothetical protein